MKPGDKVICTFAGRDKECLIVDRDCSQGELAQGWHVVQNWEMGGRFYVNEERNNMRLIEAGA